VRTRDMTAPRMILQYTIVEEHRLRHPIVLPIRLATQERHGVARLTACYCDMLGEDGPCGRRVHRLYLPSDHWRFGCRHCHKLIGSMSCDWKRNRAVYECLARGVPGLTPRMTQRFLQSGPAPRLGSLSGPSSVVAGVWSRERPERVLAKQSHFGQHPSPAARPGVGAGVSEAVTATTAERRGRPR
jgi:hypothetical protein